ncbi:MAG TPA: hypothetical protein EYG99_00075 [Candidatus Pacebacteria bacterium]|nr:hypothetical protein [Candidatus Paceibacterota bacterium]
MEKRNFVRKKIKSLTLGEKLRALRKDRHLRVLDLSRSINVKVAYIEALESGQYDNLPMRVYVKGFVRSYAQFFGVPENVLLDLFDREYAVYQNIYHKDVEEEVNKLPKVPRLVFTPRIIVAIVCFFALLTVGLYLYFSIDNFISSPWIVIDTPAHSGIIEDDKVIIRGKTRSDSRVFINEQQIFVDNDGTFENEINLTQGVNVISVRSINKFNKESTEEIVVNAIYEVQKEFDVKEQKNIRLIVKSQNEPVWINVIVDDNDVYNNTLQLDQEEIFEASEGITMTTSNGLNTLVSDDDGETFKPISEEGGIVRDWKYEVVEIDKKGKSTNDKVGDDEDSEKE